MTTDMTASDGFGGQDLPVPQNSVVGDAEQARSTEEVRSALIIAKKFPRNINEVYTNIMAACDRFSLAKSALYAYPKGGGVVTGASIRLAEVCAQAYGNLDFGVRWLEQRPARGGEPGMSVAESYCWDMQTNTRRRAMFQIPHQIKAGNKLKELTDPREIYELVANNGSRRLRACIFGIIPGDIRESAELRVRKTLEAGQSKMSVEERIRACLLSFKEIGVDKAMLEARLKHTMELVTVAELVDLAAINKSIRDKEADRGDFFDLGSAREPTGKAAEMAERLARAAPDTQKA